MSTVIDARHRFTLPARVRQYFHLRHAMFQPSEIRYLYDDGEQLEAQYQAWLKREYEEVTRRG